LRKRRRWKQSLAVLLLDLDRFKTINDTLGHAAGDELLQEVGKRLHNLVGETSTVARLGGDEFGVITEVVDKQQLEKFATSIVEALNFRTTAGSQPVWVNVSVGAALATIPRPTLQELLSRADVALYQAKGAGRNQMCVFEPHRPLPAVSQLSMDYELKLAVERSQLLVYYQPVIVLETGRIDGFEALVRWKHPYFGFVSPETFVPMAEENGAIQEIGRWVMHEACNQLASWHNVFGESLQISINLSALQISQSNIAFEVAQVLEATGVPPDKVHLEMTETAFGYDELATMDGIIELRKLGTRLAIDDFGVGYSSLNYLRRFPADFLKIDRSFVEEVDDARTFGVIRAAIEVGHVLGMQIIAEGVETEDQARLLLRAGCDFAQGYLFYRPMPAQEATQIMLDEMYALSDDEAPERGTLGYAA
jgi:diguanylate cyclase (GGDEF)-like protein